MPDCDTLIRNVQIVDGSGGEPRSGSVAIVGARISAVGEHSRYSSGQAIDGEGRILAPGFIDAHTHDDLYVIQHPEMLPKLSQGVTTVIVGNCGISAAPVKLAGDPVDPMNLLGSREEFRYPTFAKYADALKSAQPAVNVCALVGHTSLRNNHMDRLDRPASGGEIAAMRAQLRESLDHGALGLSTGLAYASASSATAEEVKALAEVLTDAGAIYATHLRSESDRVEEAIEDALSIGHHATTPVVISHLKCAGIDNWNRSSALLQRLDHVSRAQPVGWDCYPYTASSSTLDLRQVDERLEIKITWSSPHPAMAGKTLAEIAEGWKTTQREAARRLQPAGAIYHCMSESDMLAILRHAGTMIGSDGLPNDPRPHPRLWATFPRVLGQFCREQKLFSLGEAVRKMTSLPAQRFGLTDRGWVKEGFAADLVLFDAQKVMDTATYANPVQAAIGIDAVWVNGMLAYRNGESTSQRAGCFLPHRHSN